MEKFVRLTATMVPLPVENVDTDQIIPARFLKALSKDGFGDYLFYDWRYDAHGQPIESFVLHSEHRGEILVAGKNFGCGSSREHAAWAIAGYGFRVVVSSFFADIFKNNAMNNGLLPVVVSESFLADILKNAQSCPQATLTVDLEQRLITDNTSGRSETFAVNAYKQLCFLNGLDDIDYLLSKKEQIEAFERTR
jgi:3-isopropylmalate/(R)-2-methylmalate dehydratase small subunit